jgi:hypothetical protein
MNRLKTLLALSAATFMMFAASPAQAGKAKLGAAGALVMPVGDWGDVQGIGAGAMLTVDMGIDKVKNLQLTGRLGYMSFAGTEISSSDGVGGTVTADTSSIGMIPILVGAKYFLAPGLYAGAEMGPNFFMIEDVDTEMEIAFTLGLGYMIKDVDIRGFLFMPNLFPEGDNVSATDIMALGLSVGYRFKTL